MLYGLLLASLGPALITLEHDMQGPVVLISGHVRSSKFLLLSESTPGSLRAAIFTAWQVTESGGLLCGPAVQSTAQAAPSACAGAKPFWCFKKLRHFHSLCGCVPHLQFSANARSDGRCEIFLWHLACTLALYCMLTRCISRYVERDTYILPFDSTSATFVGIKKSAGKDFRGGTAVPYE